MPGWEVLDARATKYNSLFENVVPGRDGRNVDNVRSGTGAKGAG
jgi:hypothetical protein